ncbi:hypothetical protein R1flu_016878 [Riccia fluitans]|uniref:U-box domain-containing protein n=1 Tax=Riccia fluitans TaxID=41844 RepID=A0ABD1YN38_9MARC
MAEDRFVVADLEDGILRLKSYLLRVIELQEHSIKLVEKHGSLANEVKETNTFMEEALAQEKFERLWIVKETRSELELQRLKIVSAFQLAFFITTLDVVLDGHKKTNNFQERMQQLYSVHTSDSAAARTQIQDLLQSLDTRISSQNAKLQSLIRYMESGGGQSSGTESTDTQKFFADVLTAVDGCNQLQDGYQLEELMFDSLHTEDLMWDPVKASDGYTYDRWTIVENDDHPDPAHRSLSDGRSPFSRAPLSILCDDVTVRQRLYTIEKFRNKGVEEKSKEMREKYRAKTLKLVEEGHDGEALERLENVLKWAPDDEVCRNHQDVISNRLRQHRNEISDRLDKSESFVRLGDENHGTVIESFQPQSQPDDPGAALSWALDAGLKLPVYALIVSIFVAVVFTGFQGRIALEEKLEAYSISPTVTKEAENVQLTAKKDCKEEILAAKNGMSRREKTLYFRLSSIRLDVDREPIC